MKLKQKGKINIFDAIVIGEYDSLENNEPLASMLDIINNNGLNAFYANEQLAKFAKGLVSSFRDEGLMTGDVLSQDGKDIIESRKSWKRLKGQFRITVAFKDNFFYLVDALVNCDGSTTGYELKQMGNIRFDGEYTNNFDKRFKGIKFDSNWYVSPVSSIEMDSCYDYIKNKNVYELSYNERHYSFDENEFTFRLFDSYNAVNILTQSLQVYKDLQVDGVNIRISQYDSNNPLIDGVITDIFQNGYFNYVGADYSIENIRLDVNNTAVAKGILIRFLLNHATKKYLGYGEISSLISEFYSLFNSCELIEDTTQQIYVDLLERSKAQNLVAHLRLLAYQDLLPAEMDRGFELSIRDFSNTNKSMSAIVKEMFGGINGLKTITIATQYACKNIGISRNILLFAKSLKQLFNIQLNVISCYDDTASDIAISHYKNLKHSGSILNFVEVDKNEIARKVHDRYIYVEKIDGKDEWYKMSGELDAIRYNNDFVAGEPNKAINESTIAFIKEMTVSRIDESGIINDVKALMGRIK